MDPKIKIVFAVILYEVCCFKKPLFTGLIHEIVMKEALALFAVLVRELHKELWS